MTVNSRTRPDELFRDPAFWKENNRSFVIVAIGMAAAFCVCLLFGVIPLGTLLHGAGWSSYLTVFIQLVIFVVGAITIYRSARFISRWAVEEAVAVQVTHTSDETVRSIRDGRMAPPELEQVPTVFPDNHDSTLCSLRICHAIHTDAMDRQFYNRETILAHYQDELADGMHEAQGYQRLALHLGIFGTFLGLALAMPDIVVVAQNKETVHFEELFRHLQICFNTSVVGLLTSMIIWLTVLVSSQNLRRCVTKLEDCTGSLLALVRNASNRFISAQSFEQVNNTMNELATRVYNQNLSVERQTAALSAGMDKLKGARELLDKFVDGFGEVKVKLLDEAGKLGKELSPATFFDRVNKELSETLLAMSEKIRQSVSAGLESIETSRNTLVSASAATADLVKQLVSDSSNARRHETEILGQVKTWLGKEEEFRKQELDSRDRRFEEAVAQRDERFSQSLKERDEHYERVSQSVSSEVAETVRKLGEEKESIEMSRQEMMDSVRSLLAAMQRMVADRVVFEEMLRHLEVLSNRAQSSFLRRLFRSRK